MKLIRCCVGQ